VTGSDGGRDRRPDNHALEPTANSLRSCVAPAIGGGSPRAFGSSIAALILLCKNPWSTFV
jgi:hypothetical protein